MGGDKWHNNNDNNSNNHVNTVYKERDTVKAIMIRNSYEL